MTFCFTFYSVYSNDATKPPAVLEEGSRCIFCLTPFNMDKLKDNTDNCIHHPGFIGRSPFYKYNFKEYKKRISKV